MERTQLIWFSLHGVCAELVRTLGAIGRPTRAVDGLRDSAAIDPSAPSAVYLGAGALDSSAVDGVLHELKRRPRLVIVDKRETWPISVIDRGDDFVFWPCLEGELSRRISRTFGVPGLRPSAAEDGLVQRYSSLGLIGRSPAFLEILRVIDRIAPWDVPVLLQGETGTGKEMVARAFHYLGSRRGYPFIPVNCGGIPDTLLESELFGHERGAFTDASAARAGLIEQAESGSLFLDEIEALSPRGQVTLLRFLQDREYRRLGAARAKSADVRVIAAANTSLEALVQRGRFREDLLFRLNVVPLALPSLRHRHGDVELLARHFLDQFALEYQIEALSLHPSTLTCMQAFQWPGNVRQLQNFVHRCVLFADADHPIVADPLRAPALLPATVKEPSSLSYRQAKARAVEAFERSYLIAVLEEARGNVTQAARQAGTERRAFGKLLKKHGILADGSHHAE